MLFSPWRYRLGGMRLCLIFILTLDVALPTQKHVTLWRATFGRDGTASWCLSLSCVCRSSRFGNQDWLAAIWSIILVFTSLVAGFAIWVAAKLSPSLTLVCISNLYSSSLNRIHALLKKIAALQIGMGTVKSKSYQRVLVEQAL
jgi:hypothetical protein